MARPVCRHGLRLARRLSAWAAVAVAAVAAAAESAAGRAGMVAPPPVFRETRTGPPAGTATKAGVVRAGTPTLYSIGEPSDSEQLFVELINRARADAAAEAERLATTTDAAVFAAYAAFGVDLDLLRTQFGTLTPALPPLSINPRLTAAARLHSQDMFANVFQGHTSSAGALSPNVAGDSAARRVERQGYDYAQVAENVYANGTSVGYAHAGFEVDWGGPPPSGMQSPPGHRLNIHDPGVREVGVGVVAGSNSAGVHTVGPLVVTQDFGAVFDPVPFITGVAYVDLDGDGAYDLGEGLGGVRVDVQAGASYAVTAAAGGYSVPVSGNGTWQVTFSGLGVDPAARAVAVTGGTSRKLDLVVPYVAPVLTGPTVAVLDTATEFGLSATPGASGYALRRASVAGEAWSEGAEAGLSGVTADVSDGYAVVTEQAVASGAHAFHLAHSQPQRQALTLNRVLLPAAGSHLRFAKRLGWAAAAQTARAEVAPDPGLEWVTVWSQAGSDSIGDEAFTTVDVSLAAYAGVPLRVRFAYDFAVGTYYDDTGPGVGLYVDDITVTEAAELRDLTTVDLGAASIVTFTPSVAGVYWLAVQAVNGTRSLPLGPGLQVTVPEGRPALVTCTIDGPAEARWRVSGGLGYDSGWLGSGQELPAVAPGTYTMTFPNVPGWVRPVDRAVTVNADPVREAVTYTALAGAADSDADGLPDDWEQRIVDADPGDAHATVADVQPAGDFDGDGLSQADEFRFGSDPASPASYVVSLGPGWNLVSLCVAPVEATVTALFGLYTLGEAWTWDLDHYRQVESLDSRHGFWLYREQATTVTVQVGPAATARR